VTRSSNGNATQVEWEVREVRGGGVGGRVQGRDPPGGVVCVGGGGIGGQRPSSEGELPPDEYIETLWTYPGSLCYAASASTHLPDARIPLPDEPRGPELAEGSYNLGKNNSGKEKKVYMP
jgi:hypothetical protein